MTGLRIATGQACCVEPDEAAYHYQVFVDHPTIDRCGEIQITDHGSYVVVRFVQANRVLCITPWGRLETRAADAVGLWEQLHRTGSALWRNGVPGGPLTIDGAVIVTPPSTPLHLEVRNQDFVDADGQPACYSGVDMFPAFRMWRDQQRAELEALVAESHEFDWQWWRVFMMGSQAQNQIFTLTPHEPGYYDDVRPFADWLNARGIGLLAEIYVDNQDVHADAGHWLWMADRLRGSVTILSGGNEAPKNGFDPQALADPRMIWSRGSSTADSATPANGAPCASFHQRTDWPATLMDAVASEVFLSDHGYPVLLMDEPTRFDEHSNKSGVADSVRFAYVLARIYGALWDLVVFHNYCGQRGIRLTPNLRTVAGAWSRGMRL